MPPKPIESPSISSRAGTFGRARFSVMSKYMICRPAASDTLSLNLKAAVGVMLKAVISVSTLL